MVEEGESEDLENVVDYTEKLRAVLPPSVQVAYLHGKMRPADKNRIMEEFAAKEIDVLVSTTVIEVGINVPNATVMRMRSVSVWHSCISCVGVWDVGNSKAIAFLSALPKPKRPWNDYRS